MEKVKIGFIRKCITSFRTYRRLEGDINYTLLDIVRDRAECGMNEFASGDWHEDGLRDTSKEIKERIANGEGWIVENKIEYR